MPTGSLALILHAHLPFVRHPEHEDFLEEDWLFEAITETYLPLLRVLRQLARDGLNFKLTLSLTPTLCAMLRDELLQQRYLRHLARLIAFAEQEEQRYRHHSDIAGLACFYRGFFAEAGEHFEHQLHCDIVRAFRELQDDGFIEIVASAATHAFLPLLDRFSEAQRAQVRIGCDEYRAAFGREPRGFWLPECGYSAGLETLLQEANIRWFALDTHGLLLARPRPRYALFAPCYTSTGPVAFARDRELSSAIWNAESGYPGAAVYRDFYRDAGFDRNAAELHPFVRPAGVRKFTGLKYHRITGRTEEKEFYQPARASAAAGSDAEDFFRRCEQRFAELRAIEPRPTVVVVALDAELFGHWWFEGPQFLESFIRQVNGAPASFRLTTPGEFLCDHPTQQVVRPAPSSWGENGFSATWLDESNGWIYPPLHAASRRMTALARANRDTAGPLLERALRQAARELLLAQASDWAFLIHARTATEYATRRTKDHLARFARLSHEIETRRIDPAFLAECEERGALFPALDWRHYL